MLLPPPPLPLLLSGRTYFHPLDLLDLQLRLGALGVAIGRRADSASRSGDSASRSVPSSTKQDNSPLRRAGPAPGPGALGSFVFPDRLCLPLASARLIQLYGDADSGRPKGVPAHTDGPGLQHVDPGEQ